jgi:hypothetical protein
VLQINLAAVGTDADPILKLQDASATTLLTLRNYTGFSTPKVSTLDGTDTINVYTAATGSSRNLFVDDGLSSGKKKETGVLNVFYTSKRPKIIQSTATQDPDSGLVSSTKGKQYRAFLPAPSGGQPQRSNTMLRKFWTQLCCSSRVSQPLRKKPWQGRFLPNLELLPDRIVPAITAVFHPGAATLPDVPVPSPPCACRGRIQPVYEILRGRRAPPRPSALGSGAGQFPLCAPDPGSRRNT